MRPTSKFAMGLAVVVASVLALFALPRGYFVAATFFATTCMTVASFASGRVGLTYRPRASSIALGLVSAALLYLVFYAGGAAIDAFHPFGVTSGSESSIYSLIASPTNPLYLQVALLLFDSVGYESYFRGVLQGKLQGRWGAASAPMVATFDAALHLATLNPLWVGATFVTDTVWGLTYFYGKGTQSSFVSHFAWDVAIFILRPVT